MKRLRFEGCTYSFPWTSVYIIRAYIDSAPLRYFVSLPNNSLKNFYMMLYKRSTQVILILRVSKCMSPQKSIYFITLHVNWRVIMLHWNRLSFHLLHLIQSKHWMFALCDTEVTLKHSLATTMFHYWKHGAKYSMT